MYFAKTLETFKNVKSGHGLQFDLLEEGQILWAFWCKSLATTGLERVEPSSEYQQEGSKAVTVSSHAALHESINSSAHYKFINCNFTSVTIKGL